MILRLVAHPTVPSTVMASMCAMNHIVIGGTLDKTPGSNYIELVGIGLGWILPLLIQFFAPTIPGL